MNIWDRIAWLSLIAGILNAATHWLTRGDWHGAMGWVLVTALIAADIMRQRRERA